MCSNDSIGAKQTMTYTKAKIPAAAPNVTDEHGCTSSSTLRGEHDTLRGRHCRPAMDRGDHGGARGYRNGDRFKYSSEHYVHFTTQNAYNPGIPLLPAMGRGIGDLNLVFGAIRGFALNVSRYAWSCAWPDVPTYDVYGEIC